MKSPRQETKALFLRAILGIVFLPFGVVWYSSHTWATTKNQEVQNQEVYSQLESILHRQAVAWNSGDLEQFMSAYWKDDLLTFSSGGNTTRGWTKTLERYQKRYPNRQEMGKLEFSQIETSLLSDNVAMVLGRWKLEKEKGSQGNFTLVWKKIEGTWLIIHDHSSLDGQ